METATFDPVELSKEYMTLKQAADYLGAEWDYWKVYSLTLRKDLPSVKIGYARLVKRTDIEALKNAA